MGGHLLLYLHGTTHCPVDAVENDKKRVTSRIDDPTAMLVDGWIDQSGAEGPEPFKRPDIIEPNQAAVTNHVSMDDGDQPPSH